MNQTQKRTKPRLLYVENFLWSFQSSRMGVARAAAAQGFEVHAAVPFDGHQLSELDGNIEWHDLGIGRSLSASGEAGTLKGIAALYSRLRPDLVHHVRMKPVVYGSLVARILRIPAVVNTLTGMGYVFHQKSLRARLLRPPVAAALRAACGHPNQRLIVQNSEDFEFCAEAGLCPADRLVLIKGSGVDVEKFRPLPEPDGTPLVVLPGRMLWDKGVGEFVEAAEKLRAAGVRARFVLVGPLDKHSPAAIPAATVEAWQKSGVVEWWGWRDDMREVIAQSNIVCLPSHGEGAPRALMEAAACERAIVTTAVSGCSDVVIDRYNGLLVPTRNAAALAEAIGRLIEQPELRAKLAGNGPALMAAEFSLPAVIAKSLAVYREVLGRRDRQFSGSPQGLYNEPGLVP